MAFDVNKALESTYRQALRTATKDIRVFLKKYNNVMSGVTKPPRYYVDTGQVEFWQRGYLNALYRKYNVIEILGERLSKARHESAAPIMDHLMREYSHGWLGQVKTFVDALKPYGITPSFTVMDERAVRAAVSDSCARAPMSQIKVIDQYVTQNGQKQFVRQYIDMKQNDRLRTNLQQQLGAAIANGQSQTKVIERIQKTFGTQAANAKRIAQTEGTRVRNEAAYTADEEASEMGIEYDRVWMCNHNHSRDGHIQTHMQKADENGCWYVPWQSGKSSGVDYMQYPADPSASAANVCNCHCYVLTQVHTESSAMQKIRDRAAQRNAQFHAAHDNNWRDDLFGDGNHPYARNGE